MTRSSGELWRELLQRRARRERIARILYFIASAALVAECGYILFH